MGTPEEVFTASTLHQIEVLTVLTDQLTHELEAEQSRQYDIMPIKDFDGMAAAAERLIAEGISARAVHDATISAAMKVYWTEILKFVHIDATCGLLRQRGWADAIQEAVRGRSFFSFVANLRAFLESAADVHYSLRGLPTIGQNIEAIRSAVSGRLTFKLTAPELEEELKHFLFRGQARRQQLPRRCRPSKASNA